MLVTGPESAGKSTLSRQLAWMLDGVFVPEVARAYLLALDRPYTYEDLPVIWRRQEAAETVAVATGASFVICDTGPEVIRIWSEVKYGKCSPEVHRASREHEYDLTLLCNPDLPWTYDPLREHPDAGERLLLYSRYDALLVGAVPISGTDRAVQALNAIRTTLGRPRSKQ